MNALEIVRKRVCIFFDHEEINFKNKIESLEETIAHLNKLPNFKFPHELREIYLSYSKILFENYLTCNYNDNEQFDFSSIDILNVVENAKEAFEFWYYPDEPSVVPNSLLFKDYTDVFCFCIVNGEGGMLLMGHSEKYYGQIFFLNAAAFGDETTYKLADSLGEFLNKLT